MPNDLLPGRDVSSKVRTRPCTKGDARPYVSTREDAPGAFKLTHPIKI